MDAAVPPFYAPYHQHGSDQGSPNRPSFAASGGVARMVKRGRLDSSDELAGGWEHQHQHQQHQQHHQQPPPQQQRQQQLTPLQPPHSHPSGYAPPQHPISRIASFGNHPTPNAAGQDLAASHAPAGALQHEASAANHRSAAAPSAAADLTATGSYSAPEVSSYSRQPYYSFQHTDPSTYNSPWPPTAASASTAAAAVAAPPYGNQTNSYSMTAPPSLPPPQATAMPYFPPQSTSDVGENSFVTDAALPVQSYSQDVDMMPSSHHGYSRSQSGQPVQSQQQQSQPQRNDARSTSSAIYYEDASMHLKIQSLSILENLATQLIHTIAKASYPQIQEIMRGAETEEGQAYTTLKNLFDQTRKVYNREPFIDAIAIQMFQPAQQEVIRKANIATFVSSILGAHDVSFFHLNEFFMETFVPLGHRLLKWQGAIYLELKTQTYISALINSDGTPQAMLDELFPSDLDAQILTRHPDAPSLSPSEQDFIDRSRARKNYLLAEDNTDQALRELPKKYQWHDFVREFAACISKNVEGTMNLPARSQPNFSGNAADRRAAAAAALHSSSNQQSNGRNAGSLPNISSFLTESGGAVARDGAGDAVSKRPNASAMRQPWTKPEEDALLSGLDQVNGPHWSHILALYGRGGSISEVLKDRNQVQLKDKARNLKLWYLKMGKDVPPALRGVTGELRKRGGARARAALGLAEDEAGDVENANGDVEADADAEGMELERSQSRGKGTKKSKKR